jgi:hypothetical protein
MSTNTEEKLNFSTKFSSGTIDKFLDKPTHLIFMNEKEFCSITGHKLSTARSNRIKGIGCNFYKIGGSVRYKLSEIIEYIESCKCSSTTKKL